MNYIDLNGKPGVLRPFHQVCGIGFLSVTFTHEDLDHMTTPGFAEWFFETVTCRLCPQPLKFTVDLVDYNSVIRVTGEAHDGRRAVRRVETGMFCKSPEKTLRDFAPAIEEMKRQLEKQLS
jgi:hypothetical protein